MKVLHLTHTDISSDSRVLKELDVVSRIKNVSVFAIGVKSKEPRLANEAVLNCDIKEIKSISNSFLFLPRAIRYFFSIIEINIKILIYVFKIGPNIVHCHDTLVLPSGIFAKLICNSYCIYDAHELESNKAGQNCILSLATIVIEKISWRYVDHFISVSQSIIDWYLKKFSIKPHTLILNSPVDELSASDIAKYSDQYLREKYNIPENALIYIYVGNLVKGRGIDLFLSVFSSAEVSSHIVLLGNGEMESEIIKCAERSEKIHHHAAVAHSEVVQIAKTADVGLCMIEPVSLSDFYALPNKLFEYLDSGLHVICSDMPEISRIIRGHNLGVVAELSESKFKDLILSQEAKKPSRNHIFIEELTWNYQRKKLIDLYSLIQNNRLKKF